MCKRYSKALDKEIAPVFDSGSYNISRLLHLLEPKPFLPLSASISGPKEGVLS